ncbi:small integral membrane protein 8 [Atheta coriaria]|uniref:small integral membrane protein 8 n=1 Tax=Dalotia coriaria TaxID=877792 RepID=UPI0031F417E0
MSEKNEKNVPDKHQPGDGIRSMKTSRVFRVVNFELYAKPNMVVMAIGLTAFIGCSAYIAYMRSEWADRGYYSTYTADGEETFKKRKSRWD